MASTADNSNSTRGIPGVGPLHGGQEERQEGGRKTVDFGRDTGALLAAIPAMLGFIPENSMVLLGLSAPQQPTGATGPAIVPAMSSEVGPVVRAELVEQAVEAAAEAVVQAHRGREEKEAIIVVIGGDATPLISCAHRRLRESGIHVPAAFVVAQMSGGALWWEVPAEGRMTATGGGSRPWLVGELPDPRRSLAMRREPGQRDSELMGQQRFAGMFDPVPLSETLEGVLPESWRDSPGWEVRGRQAKHGGEFPPEPSPMGRHTTGTEPGLEASGELQSAYSVCVLVDELVHDLDTLAPLSAPSGGFIRFLHRTGKASHIADVCDDPRLFPMLLALAAGSGRSAVTSLLLGTAQVARGLLRQRALALLAVVAWCTTGGVVAHRAAYRAIAEIRTSPEPAWATGTREECAHNLARAEVTIALASRILRAIEQGETSTKARDILGILDEGMALIELALTTVNRHGGEGSEHARALFGRVVDREGFSRVRSELGNRVAR